jgi:hypothetical protein
MLPPTLAMADTVNKAKPINGTMERETIFTQKLQQRRHISHPGKVVWEGVADTPKI